MKAVKTPGRYMDMGYFLVGLCLLWMPTVAVFDLLPACLGYLLLMRGLYRLSDLNDEIDAARRLFRRAAILGLIRYLSIPFVFGFVSADERPVMILTVTFTLAVLDLMTLIPAWKRLCGGVIYLATRHEGTAVFHRRGRDPRNATERLTSFTVFFLVAKEILATLPELTVLVSQWGGADTGEGWFLPQLYSYVGLLRLFAATIAFVIGIVWLVHTMRYAGRLAGDRSFFANLRHRYETTVLNRPELFAKRSVKAALVCLCIGFAFSVDLFLDGINVLPDTLVALVALLGICLLRRYADRRRWRWALVATALYAPISAAEWLLQLKVFPLADAYQVYRNASVYQAYLMACGGRAVSRLFFLVTLGLILWMVKDIIDRYTGFSVTQRDSADPHGHVKAIHRELYRRLYIVLALGGIAAVSSVIYIATLPMAGDTLWEAWVLADAVLHISFAVSLAVAVTHVLEQVEYKYMLS